MNNPRYHRTRLGIALALLGGVALATGAPPKVDVVFPAGGQRGTEFEVNAGGSFDPWPAEVWCSDGGLRWVAAEEKGKFAVTIGKEVEPGAKLLRFHNPEGSSAPRLFVVGDHPEVLEKEPNNALADAHPIDRASLPIVVNGKLDPGGDVDGFAIDLAQGETLVATLDAYALDSPIDPLLHIRDANGTRLAFNHDATDIGLDPRLVFVAPKAGRYTVRLFGFTYPPTSSHRFGGSSKAAYRLTLSAAAPPPPQPGLEPEPEEQAIPFRVEGSIDPPGDHDIYRFAAKKGDKLVFAVRAAELGSLLDPELRIAGADDKELGRADDIDAKTNHDIRYDWTAPADGTFTARLSDVAGKGGPEFAYRLEVDAQQPDFEATTDTHSLAIKPGGTAELPIKVNRRYGHAEALIARLEGLPDGITAEAVEVAEKAADAKFALKAAADAKPARGTISAWVGERRVSIKLKGDSTDAGDLLSNETGSVWLTVLPDAG